MESHLDQSIFYFIPGALALLANNKGWDDLSLFLKSLKIWNTTIPPIYLFCDSIVQSIVQKEYSNLDIKTNPCLDAYTNTNREFLEKQSSLNGLKNRFHDFVNEKCSLVQWALESMSIEDQKRGVLFCDADLFWLAPLPSLPNTVTLGLSRHQIRESDEEKYGMYNAGLVWTNQISHVLSWKDASSFNSKFFEQSALEDVAKTVSSNELYEFGSHVNYGWWRMYQSSESVSQRQKAWSIKRDSNEQHSGILINGEPLICIHTHWKTKDYVTSEFNKWVLSRLELVKKQKKVASILRMLQ